MHDQQSSPSASVNHSGQENSIAPLSIVNGIEQNAAAEEAQKVILNGSGNNGSQKSALETPTQASETPLSAKTDTRDESAEDMESSSGAVRYYRGVRSGEAGSYSQRFLNLPIQRKQFFVTGASFAAIVLIAVAGATSVGRSLRTQLLQQAGAESQVIGELVSEEISSNKLQSVTSTLKAFGQGYSAVYVRQPNGGFSLATSALDGQGVSASQSEWNLEKSSLLDDAVKAAGQPITRSITIGSQNYAVAAVAVSDAFKEVDAASSSQSSRRNAKGHNDAGPGIQADQPVSVLVRAIPEAGINSLSQRSLMIQLILGLVLIGINLALALLVARSLIEPITNLKQTTQKVAEGDREARAKVFAGDEIGELAKNFNQLADKIVESEQALASNFEQRRQEVQELADEQQRQNQALQFELIELLSEVESASSGDLTVRADTTAGQVGVVADFFNTIIESMRDIVVQVKQSTTQVNDSLAADERSMGELAEGSRRQAKKMGRTLEFMEQMVNSIQEVATNAQQTAEVARSASTTAESGGEAMDQTVDTIVQLRETVAETAKKVKRLGESSQQISKAVSLINQIAMQTNLLAINAGIEAARAGEEGRGFGVVAEEIGALASKSAEATKEIEQIVDAIQLETSDVVNAMELGTSQVVEGTGKVEAAKQSLEQIISVSRQIDQLVQSISEATESQTKTSGMVADLIKDAAEISEQSSDASSQIASSLEDTVTIAQQLQASVDAFQIAPQT